MKYLTLPTFFLLPATAFAAQGLQEYIPELLDFVNDSIIPFIIGIAFLVFVFNVIRYFVAGSTNKDVQETARAYAMYSVFAFVFIIIFWGIINLLTFASDLDGYDSRHPNIPGYEEWIRSQ